MLRSISQRYRSAYLRSIGMAVSALGAAFTFAAELPPAATKTIDFARDIQPILAHSCQGCHGEKKQESGLRLDSHAAVLRGGDHGPALVPGKGAESLLVLLTAGEHNEIAKMPRKGDPLTEEQIGLLRAWVDQGAKWPQTSIAGATVKSPENHWAFRAPVRPEAPAVKNKKWSKTPIDTFILSRLEKEGLKPSAEADKTTMLRRLHLDLTGLPPSIAEVDAFLADKSPEAWQKQVERLLNSPHYGERWGRHWLDAARYADSEGFEKDKSRQIWNYRDWVISAINRDLPYDQFVIEQLAGDLLPNATQDQRVATGFLRNSMINEEGGVDPEQFRMDAMFDRMDAVGKSVLGLTIQCAQCHTHKFDPLTQEEYYRMFSFLNNDHEATIVTYTPDELMKREELVRQMREIVEDLQHRTPNWQEQMAAWENTVRDNQPRWHVVSNLFEDISTGGQKYSPMPDGSFYACGYAPTKHTAWMEVSAPITNITAVQLELLTDANLPCNGPGRSIWGTCVLTDFYVDAGPSADKRARQKIASVTADYANGERALESVFDDLSKAKRVTGPVEFAIDNKDETGWGIDAGPGQRNQERKAVFVLATNLVFEAGQGSLKIGIKQNHGGWNSDDNQNNNLGRFRISVTDAADAKADLLPKRVREILAIPAAERSPAQVAAVFNYWRTTVPDWKDINERVAALYKDWPVGSTTLALVGREEARDTRVLRRGDWLKPTKQVTPGVPAFLHQLPENADPNRLTFAKWLVDRKSPTTARVFVNRVWQSYFGTGLVATPEDFGMQADEPSHPELLDWLAVEFMDKGWSLKSLHRLIVNSAVYRQSSRVSPELFELDAYNRLLARGPRFRVEGEIVRDIALASSGLLNPKMGGPSVFAPAPKFLFQPPASYGPFEWNEVTGAERYRRALYTFRRRSTPYPMLQNFDVPNADFSCVRRARSNTPLQALTTLNETVFMECAQSLARVTLQDGGKTDEARITHAFRRVVSRPPTAKEMAELLSLLERQKDRIGEGWVNPYELSGGKNEIPKDLPSGTTPTQLAAYTVVSRVLLNLDETITKE